MISVKNTMGKRRMNNEKGTQSDEATSWTDQLLFKF